jgi:hypothetical protein
MRFHAGCFISLMGLLLGQPAVAYTHVYFGGGTPTLNDDGSLEIDGVHATGDGSSLNDALNLNYRFDLKTLDFKFLSKTVYKNIGVYNEDFMAVNVTPLQPTGKFGNSTLQAGSSYNITNSNGKTPFVYNLKVGHVMSWYITNLSVDSTFKFDGPSASQSFIVPRGAGGITNAIEILKPGRYTLKVAPIGASSTNYSITAWNANNRPLTSISNGSTISVSFRDNLHDYAKYKIELKAGQILRLPGGSSEIQFVLLTDIGEKVAEYTGVPFAYEASKAGPYYLFIRNSDSFGGSYFGGVSVASSSVDPTIDSDSVGRPNGLSRAH